MKSFVQKEALIQWQELRALEMLWSEIADECDGEDLRLPRLKEQAGEMKARLLTLLAELGPKQAKHPPEPSDEVISAIRSHFDEAMRLMGFREPL